MLEAKPEKVEARETMVTIRAFCRGVKMLYGMEGGAGASSGGFSTSVMFLDHLVVTVNKVIFLLSELWFYIRMLG